ncbi:protein inscuteable homolog [Ischnura elegans]|uniref:protein inscuteable homolog n=1 Tax=Ischnura elegans TaxID=197161 RepID=UPI001ED8829D|nr:protein inscuteable homolog [Ischnura elegans]XP_046394801.1 protein inscuteable homolog [Ischnura elegans]XP_046394802.1 protein inscuteable homolog [Ischnura elegans]
MSASCDGGGAFRRSRSRVFHESEWAEARLISRLRTAPHHSLALNCSAEAAMSPYARPLLEEEEEEEVQVVHTSTTITAVTKTPVAARGTTTPVAARGHGSVVERTAGERTVVEVSGRGVVVMGEEEEEDEEDVAGLMLPRASLGGRGARRGGEDEWGGERRSPSHKSQDSGFSDSEPEAKSQGTATPPGSGAGVEGTLPQELSPPAHTSTPKAGWQLALERSEKAKEVPPKSGAAAVAVTEDRGTPTTPLGTRGPNARAPTNLTHWFNSCRVSRPSPRQDPVAVWLSEVAALCEPECMATLQSKSLLPPGAAALPGGAAAMASDLPALTLVADARDAVRSLQLRAHVISAEFVKLCQQMETGCLDQAPPLIQSLVGHMTEFVRDCHGGADVHPKDCCSSEESSLLVACDRLRLASAPSLAPLDPEVLAGHIAKLGHAFTHVVDLVLSREIQVLVTVLEDAGSELAQRSALTGLAALGLEGAHLSRLVAQCGGVRALLAVAIDSRSSPIRASALRALATICCVSDAIKEFEKAGGIEIIADILMDSGREIAPGKRCRPEPEASEAAAVLAQVTAPWLEEIDSVEGLVEYIRPIVHSLSRLVEETRSTETLLLAAAALANLTFMEPRAVWPLVECSGASKLLAAVRGIGPRVPASVFLREQAATLIANMAAVPETRTHLGGSGEGDEGNTVAALLSFLQVRLSPLQRVNETAAAERLQQKAAIALSRLCSDPLVAKQVVEMKGVSQIVRLCVDEKERNHSDGVLVACLAALRKIAANCGTKVIEELGAMDLVEPRLLDSFLVYSSRQESYV